MLLRYRGGDILDFRGDLVILGHFCDTKPLTGAIGRFDWRSGAAVSRLWKVRQEMFEFGRLTLVPSQGKIPSAGVLIAGLGPRPSFSRDLRREIHRLSLCAASRMKVGSVAAEALAAEGEPGMDSVEDFVQVLEKDVKGAFQGVVLSVSNPSLLSSLHPVAEQEIAEPRAAPAAGN